MSAAQNEPQLPAQNPKLLVCDSDALIQLFIGNALQPLRELKRQFGVQPVITPEVELELRSLQKYAKRIDAPLTKSLNHQTIVVLSPAWIQAHLGSAADPLYAAAQALGSRYHGIVGAGEAYSHAACVTFRVPMLSNDRNAVRFLVKKGWATSSPPLRAFDLVVFGFQIGCMREQDCDAFRHQMTTQERNEAVPDEFRNRSFADGLPLFTPLLLDGSRPWIGAAATTGEAPHDRTLVIYPLQPQNLTISGFTDTD